MIPRLSIVTTTKGKVMKAAAVAVAAAVAAIGTDGIRNN
jgi:hypothetical protein